MYIVPGQSWQPLRDEILMSIGTSCHFGHLLQVSKQSFWSLILYNFCMILYRYIAPGQGQTAPRGQSFDVNRNVLSLHSFVASFHYFTLFTYKSMRDQIWPCRKIGHGQPRVIIWAHLIVLEHPMTHTKIQGHGPFGSEEKDCFYVFTIYGHGGHLGHMTRTIWANFRSPIP